MLLCQNRSSIERKMYLSNQLKVVITLLVASLLLLTGCAIEEGRSGNDEGFDSFSLNSIDLKWEDTENPSFYIVAPNEEPDKVIFYKNVLVEEAVQESEEFQYELEEVLVTDEEILIQYEGQEERFERLSQTVAENENGVRYQYFGPVEEEEE